MARRAVIPPKPDKPPERMVWRDCRCRACGRLLCRAIITSGTKIEIRCPRCNGMAVFPPMVEPVEKAVKVEQIIELATA